MSSGREAAGHGHTPAVGAVGVGAKQEVERFAVFIHVELAVAIEILVEVDSVNGRGPLADLPRD